MNSSASTDLRRWPRGLVMAALVAGVSSGCPDEFEESDDPTSTDDAGGTTSDDVGGTTSDVNGLACENFDDSDDSSDGDTPQPWDECEEQTSAIGYSDPTPLGFSAEEFLAERLGSYRVSLVFDPPAPLAEGVMDTYEVEILLAYDGGAVRYVERTDGVDEPEDWCDDWFLVDVTLGLESEDGTFAETIPGSLRSDGVMFRQILPAADVTSTFDFEGMFDEAEVCTLQLRAEFPSPELISGSIHGVVAVDGTAARRSVAGWCEPPGHLLCPFP